MSLKVYLNFEIIFETDNTRNFKKDNNLKYRKLFIFKNKKELELK